MTDSTDVEINVGDPDAYVTIVDDSSTLAEVFSEETIVEIEDPQTEFIEEPGLDDTLVIVEDLEFELVNLDALIGPETSVDVMLDVEIHDLFPEADGVDEVLIPGARLQNVYIQQDAPVTEQSTYLWIQTGLGQDAQGMTFWVEDGLD